jgi:hypothetical protein
MTDDLEISPDRSEDGANLSDLSLSSSSEINPHEDLPAELHEQIEEVLHINEDKEEDDDLTQFIVKAREQDFNCLDLSKKNIIEFPGTLLEFPSLQVINFHRKSYS